MNTLHRDGIRRELKAGWRLAKSKTHLSMILGKDGVELSLLIAVVGDEHWGNDYHEVIAYPMSARSLSRDGSCGSWGETFRFSRWNDLLSFLKGVCATDGAVCSPVSPGVVRATLNSH